MSVPSKIHNILLVQIQPEERLATTTELNLASSLVTGCGEANGMGYGAATQVKGLSPCSEAICWPCGCKTHHWNSQFGNVVISDSCWGDSTAESPEGLRTSHDDPEMTKTVPITEEGDGKEVCRLADEVAKRRSQEDDKPGGARTSGTWRGDASPAGFETVAWYQTDIMGTREGQSVLLTGVCAIKPINGKIVRMTLWESDQLIVPVKRGNARGGKGLAIEPLGHGHIHRTEGWVKDGNKTGLITYPDNDGVVFLKSRMRKNIKSGSVRGLIAASGRRWL